MLENVVGTGSDTPAPAELLTALRARDVRVWVEGDRLRLSAPKGALTELVRRHEVLRTTFVEKEGHPVQVIGAALPVTVPLSDLTSLVEPERTREAQRLAREEVRRPFDLEGGPVFRVRLLRMGEAGNQLLLTQHHIVTDGWSIALIVDEVLGLYRAFTSGDGRLPPEPPFQYGDFAHWQREWLRGDALESRLSSLHPLLA